MIKAGTVAQAVQSSGQWAIVDIGFSERSKSSALLLDDGTPELMRFASLKERLSDICNLEDGPLNLLLEAPLSVAFTPGGNPTGRAVEERDLQRRYWYVGLGCSVLIAATYLLRHLSDMEPKREVRLFEGLVSFKTKGRRSDHAADAVALRDVIWNERSAYIVGPEALRRSEDHELQSAFKAAGMDFGIPPVLIASPES